MKKRVLYYDVLKGIALFLVLYNHTYAFSLYQTETAFLNRFLSLIMVTLSTLNWPLFFMISGALLFEREESIRAFFLKRILRWCVILFIYQVFIIIINVLTQDKYYTIWQCIYGVITNDYDGSYQSTWYLYAYLGFLVILPILKKISLNIERSEFIYLLTVVFLYHCIYPMIGAYLNWKYGYELSLSVDFRIPLLVARESMYPIVGYYIDKKFDIKSKQKSVIISWMIFAGMILVSVFMELLAVYRYEQSTYPYSSMFTIFLCGHIFWRVKEYFRSHDTGFATKILQIIGRNSFGIYLISPILQTLLYKRYHLITTRIIPIWLSSILWCCTMIVICTFITTFFRKILNFFKFYRQKR